MSRAIELAQRGPVERTSPNPQVGAVVVRNKRVVAEGYHTQFGSPHAETEALNKINGHAKGATLYVTLEPCSSWGKTPPCVDTIIASGIKEVVLGLADPNPRNHHSGIKKLKQAGICVRTGVLADEVQKLNEAFVKKMKTGLPFVTLKMAQTLDGKIATSTGDSRWISSRQARLFVHRLRSQVDALLIGKNTAVLDNPRLKALRESEKPWRIVLDPDLELTRQRRVFEGRQLTLIAVSQKKIKQRISSLPKEKNRILLAVPERGSNRRLDLKFLLTHLAGLGVNHLLVEGGGEVAWSLIREGLADRLIWIVAPKIVGGKNAKTSVEGEGVQEMKKAIPLLVEKVYPLGADWIFEARLQKRKKI